MSVMLHVCLNVFDAIVFNQPLNNWNVSNVTHMDKMFAGASSLNDNNKCKIHGSFSSNNNWIYDWDKYC